MIKIKFFNHSLYLLLLHVILTTTTFTDKQLSKRNLRKNDFITSRKLNELSESSEGEYEINIPSEVQSSEPTPSTSRLFQTNAKKNSYIEDVLERELKRIKNSYYANTTVINEQLEFIVGYGEYFNVSIPSEKFLQKSIIYHKNSIHKELDIHNILKFVLETLSKAEEYTYKKDNLMIDDEYKHKINYVNNSIKSLNEVQKELTERIKQQLYSFVEDKTIKKPEMMFAYWRQYRLNIFYNIMKNNEWLSIKQFKNKVLKANKGFLSMNIGTEEANLVNILKDYFPSKDIKRILEELSSKNLNLFNKDLSFELLNQINYNNHIIHALERLKENIIKSRKYVKSANKEKSSKEKILLINSIKEITDVFHVLVVVRSRFFSYKEFLLNASNMLKCSTKNSKILKKILDAAKDILQKIFSGDGAELHNSGKIIITDDNKNILVKKVKEYLKDYCKIQYKLTDTMYVNNFVFQLTNAIG